MLSSHPFLIFKVSICNQNYVCDFRLLSTQNPPYTLDVSIFTIMGNVYRSLTSLLGYVISYICSILHPS
jgi:hypothetical protein